MFAVLITVLVLELHPPAEASYAALLHHWQQWLSYFVSYIFIAIVWTNHHYLMRYASEATPRLVWSNFAHLFAMSLLPFATEWMAASRLAAQSVSFYALVFCLVNATYLALIWELIGSDAPAKLRSRIRRRAVLTLLLFASATLIALWLPLVALGICVGCLAVYLKPGPKSDG